MESKEEKGKPDLDLRLVNDVAAARDIVPVVVIKAFSVPLPPALRDSRET